MTTGRLRQLAALTGTLTAASALLAPGAGLAAAKAPEPAGLHPSATGARLPEAFGPDEELILELRTAKAVLTDALFAYQRERRVYIPLGEFARALELAITVDAGGARGWLLAQTRVFELDLARGVVNVDGRSDRLGDGDALAHGGEIYVDAKLLPQWLPISLDVSPREALARLATREPFPFESRAARQRLWSRLSKGTSRNVEAEREAIPYELFTPPALDFTAQAGLRSKGAETAEYQARASGDLLFMNTSVFLRGKRSAPLEDLRLVMERKEPDGGLPLGATHVAFGDVFSAGLPLGVRSEAGRGLFLGDMPLGGVSAFSGVELRGEVAQGFEIELYRNGVLVDAQRESDGRYHFRNVALSYGANDLKLVFHGPRGERREEVRRMNIGDGRAPPGQLRFAASIMQQGVGLFGHDAAQDASRPQDGRWAASGYAEYGLNRRLTAALGATASLGRNPRGLTMAGIRTSLGGAALAADAAADTSGGGALQVGAAGEALGVIYALRHAEYAGGFLDETRRDPDARYRRSSELRLDRAFSARLPGSNASIPISTSLAALVDQYADGARETDVVFRTGIGFGMWSVTNTLDYAAARRRDDARSRLDGSLEAMGFAGATGVRMRLDYAPGAGKPVQGAALALDRRLGETLRGRVGAFYDFRGGGAGVEFAVAREFRNFDLGFDGRFDGRQGWMLGVRFATSLGWSPTNRSWFQARPGLARSGAVEALVFRDANGDGVRQSGESAVPGAVVSAAGRQGTTNAKGLARLAGLAEARPAAVNVAELPDEDVFTAPARGAVEVTPRPGRIHVAAFPLVVTGEVEGRARLATQSGEQIVSGVALRLIGADGRTAAVTRTEYDGRYVFEGVRPGRYRLEVDPQDATRLGLVLVEPVQVAVAAEGGVAGPIDLAFGAAAPHAPLRAADASRGDGATQLAEAADAHARHAKP